jgi:hypothetical protein
MLCSSYDLLSKKQAELERKNYQLIIMDESHCIKNDKSARTRAAEPLMKVGTVTNKEKYNTQVSKFLKGNITSG